MSDNKLSFIESNERKEEFAKRLKKVAESEYVSVKKQGVYELIGFLEDSQIYLRSLKIDSYKRLLNISRDKKLLDLVGRIESIRENASNITPTREGK